MYHSQVDTSWYQYYHISEPDRSSDSEHSLTVCTNSRDTKGASREGAEQLATQDLRHKSLITLLYSTKKDPRWGDGGGAYHPT